MTGGRTADGSGRTRLIVADTTAWQVIEHQVVMLDFGGERYFRLDPVGSRMWELLVELGDLDDVRRRLLAEYEVDEAQLREDLDEFVTRLTDAGLVRVEPAAQ
jgi:Coenzyme PQQ synthesis protein D (PqqD)